MILSRNSIPQHRPLAFLLLLAACGGGTAAQKAPLADPGDRSDGPAPTEAHVPGSVPLAGPYADEATMLHACEGAVAEASTSEVSAVPAPEEMRVGLREFRSSAAAASCAATVETESGAFVGSLFLCSADRSDEVMSTEVTSIEIEDGVATISFRVSYATRDQAGATAPATISEHVIVCSLDAEHPACTDPPTIAGYAPERCDGA